ncbi:MAG TPA: DUF5996 family protein [Gaiellaceae bacterium]|nr:DUF5996 family protein [Gaiellaceae bacterium]
MSSLPPLPYDDWEPTKQTLHLWAQIVGKVKLATSPPKNHWWHVPLYLDVHGLTTRLLHGADGRPFEIRFDLVGHRLVVETGQAEDSFALADGLSVAEFDRRLHAMLAGLDLDVPIVERPFGVATTTPFPEDTEHHSYDAEAVERFRRVLDWSGTVLEEFAGWFDGKQSPVHLFWHSFDLALTRFSGRRAPELADADPVTREAYTHEVVSFGFWAGDDRVREPAYYSYTAPEPDGLRGRPIAPEGRTRWVETGGGSLAVLPYDDVRSAADPRATVLEFLESAFEAGADAAGWNRAELRSTWCPPLP